LQAAELAFEKPSLLYGGSLTECALEIHACIAEMPERGM
jgi:hypothetical protein